MKETSKDVDSVATDWWLLRCGSCGDVLRAQRELLERSPGVVCTTCFRLLRLNEQTGQLLDYIEHTYTHAGRQSGESNLQELTGDLLEQELAEESNQAQASLEKQTSYSEKEEEALTDLGEEIQEPAFSQRKAVFIGGIFVVGFALVMGCVLQTAAYLKDKNQQTEEVGVFEELSATETYVAQSNLDLQESPHLQDGSGEGNQGSAPVATEGDQQEMSAVVAFVEQYCLASVEEKIAMSLPLATEAQRLVVQEFLESEQAPEQLGSVLQQKLIEAENGKKYVACKVEDTLYRPFSLMICLPTSSTEKMKIDAVTSFALGEASWQGLGEVEPETEVAMRVIVTSGDYFNFDYRSAAEWDCWQLEHPHSSGIWYAYSRKGSSGSKEIYALLEKNKLLKNKEKVSCLVRLKGVEEGGKRQQTELIEVIWEHWLDQVVME